MTLRIILLIFLMLSGIQHASAQGFAWEWNPRFPKATPTRFIGADIGAGVVMNSATLSYVEPISNLPCCTYEGGRGLSFRANLLAEQWLKPELAVVGGVGIRSVNASMSAEGQTVPTTNGLLVTEYNYSSHIVQLNLIGGARYRLFTSPLSVGLILRANILVSTTQEQSEDIVSAPQGYSFNGNGSQSQVLIPTFLRNAKGITVDPTITLQYDIPLQFGMYISPTIQYTFPLMSVVSDASWTVSEVSLGIRIMRGW